MASAPSEPRAVAGRVDRSGRLVSADPQLEALQREAGAALGQTLALPQIAAVARLARELGTAVSRPALAASASEDIDLWVHARPEGDDVVLSLENWVARPAAGPRLGALLAGEAGAAAAAAPRHSWSTDEELRVIALSGSLAELLGVDPAETAGVPLTRLLRLDEDDAGEMPLISALAARRGFTGQRARGRGGDDQLLVLGGEVVTAADGHFAGFRGTVEVEGAARPPVPIDDALDDVLRSPLDRIIESAEKIVERADGPLRSDYASYGSDIAAAARHLSSVIRDMGDDPEGGNRAIDLAALCAEAVVMVDAAADERKVTIALGDSDRLVASGQERAVIQILVNLIGNAIRYSPAGGTVELLFSRTAGTASVTVCDRGKGIHSGDQQRIFERFERADSSEAGTGLGLAISRRLARSMGGDISVNSAPGSGARFVLTLPLA